MTRNGSPALDRRNVLKAAGVAGVAGIAGCLDDDPTDDTPDDDDDEPADLDEIVEGGTLRTALAENIDHFDPTRSEDTTSSMADSMLFEGILTTNLDGEIYPWLATGWEEIDIQDVSMADYQDYAVTRETANGRDGHIIETFEWAEQFFVPDPDDLVLDHVAAEEAIDDGVFGMGYRFTVREGVEFHNGEMLDAETVVNSYKRFFHSQRASVVLDTWFLGVRETDEYEFELYAQEPDADFFRTISVPVWAPEQSTEPAHAIDPREDPPLTPIGSGPMVYDEFTDEEFYRIERFDNHWFTNDWFDEVGIDADEDFPESPPIEAIEFEIVREDATRAAAIQAGEIDHAYGIAAETLSDYDEHPDFRLTQSPAGGYNYFQFPSAAQGWDAWEDNDIRVGLNQLIDRDAIVENIYHGNATAARIPLSPVAAHDGVPGGADNFDDFSAELAHLSEHDPEAGAEKIEAALTDAGYDTPHEVRVVCNADNDDRVRWVSLIIEAMEDSGMFEVTFETFEWGRYTTLIIGEEFRGDNETIVAIGLGSGFSPDGYARAVAHQDNIGGCCNITGYVNPEISEQIDEARFGLGVIGEENLEDRRSIYADIWEELLENPPAAYVFFGMESDITTRDVVNWRTPPFNASKYSASVWSPASEQVAWIDRDD